jgi:hypothetical protein
MIRVFLIFLILAVLIYFGIQGIQKLTGAQALSLTKTGMYAIISATIAMVLLFAMVTVF